MSVEKVNKYKAEKEARLKTAKKENTKKLIAKILVVVVALALVVWIGFSVYQKINKDSEGTTGTTVNLNALEDYIEGFEVIEADPGE